MEPLFLLLACFPFAPTAAEKPHVFLIWVDNLKPVMGCYGDSNAKTPNLDRLASRSLRPDSADCNQAVCSPSRNALMTGLRPQTRGIYNLSTNFRKSRPKAVTVAQHFKAHGYRTEALGKIFHTTQGNTENAASWTVPHFSPLAMPTRITPPDGAPKYSPQFEGELRRYKNIPAGIKPFDNDPTRHSIHGYYAATTYMDACAGLVRDELETSGLAEDTIVILWGDHGCHPGDHRMWCKHTPEPIPLKPRTSLASGLKSFRI